MSRGILTPRNQGPLQLEAGPSLVRCGAGGMAGAKQMSSGTEEPSFKTEFPSYLLKLYLSNPGRAPQRPI